MPNTVTSPNMTIVVPVTGVEVGPAYASELQTALFTVVDQHDHSPGKGVKVPTAGLNVNADLGFGSFNAIALRSARFTSQGLPLALGSDIGCLYSVGGNAYWNDGTPTAIQLTSAGSIMPANYQIGRFGVPGPTQTILSTDPYGLYYVDCSSAVTFNLPRTALILPGRTYAFVDYQGLSEAHNISFVPNGTDTINGVNATLVVANNGATVFLSSDSLGRWTASVTAQFYERSTGPAFPASVAPLFQQTQQTAGAGNAWTFKTQASQASGNVNGGDFIFATGAGFGTGRAGAFRMQDSATDTFQFLPWVGTVGSQARVCQRTPWVTSTTSNVTPKTALTLAVPNNSVLKIRVNFTAKSTVGTITGASGYADFTAANNAGTVVTGAATPVASNAGTTPFTSITLQVSGTSVNVQVLAAIGSNVDWQGDVEVHQD